MSLPTDTGCGVGVDSRSASTASGGVTVSGTLSVGFGTSTDPRAFIGNSTGRAGFGNLGVHANARYAGSTDGFTVTGSEAFGLQTEPMTFGGATGTGFYRPTFTVDGSLFNVGRPESELAFFYSVDSGPVFLSFRIQNSRGAISYYTPEGYATSLPGISLTGDLATGLTVAGSTEFTLNIPIVFGTTTELTFALWAGSIPGSNVGLLTASEGEVDYLSSVKLTGIEVADSTGKPLDAFSIVSGSGTLYDRNGVVIVPEPATYASILLGLLGIAYARLRKRTRTSSKKPAPSTLTMLGSGIAFEFPIPSLKWKE